MAAGLQLKRKRKTGRQTEKTSPGYHINADFEIEHFSKVSRDV